MTSVFQNTQYYCTYRERNAGSSVSGPASQTGAEEGGKGIVQKDSPVKKIKQEFNVSATLK